MVYYYSDKKRSFYLDFLFEMFCVKMSCFKGSSVSNNLIQEAELNKPCLGPKVFMNMVKAIGVRVNIEYIYYNAWESIEYIVAIDTFLFVGVQQTPMLKPGHP